MCHRGVYIPRRDRIIKTYSEPQDMGMPYDIPYMYPLEATNLSLPNSEEVHRKVHPHLIGGAHNSNFQFLLHPLQT